LLNAMPWFKKDAPPPSSQPGDEPAGLDAALDTLAAVLRDYGKIAFDVEGRTAEALRQDCETWAKHLLLGGARPGEAAARGGLTLERRDWAGARRFFNEQRSQERDHVLATHAAFQQSMWAALRALDAVVAEGEEADGRAGAQMQRLKELAGTGSAEQMRLGVLEVVEEMALIAREKVRRQAEAVHELSAQVARLGEELEIARLESALDPLTRLYNRRAFDERCGQVMAMRRLFGEPSSLVMVDIDRFKEVNDRFGHPAGDTVLRAVADTVARSFASRSDFVARYGGEEFAVILWGTPAARAKAAAERLLATVRAKPIAHEAERISVTASAGVAELAPGEAVEAWIARADKALYEAKRAGRDRVVAA
jgi:diguanylate cyclase (GGDEF)-like protein